jgi:tetratricopeptide (TPR) repeat protein
MRALLGILLLASAVAADVVHLKNGGKVEGVVTQKGDRIEIETPAGKVTVAAEDVVRIEKKASPAPAAKGAPERRNVRLGPTYAHPFHGFKLWLPPKWARGKEQGSATMSFYGPRDQAYIPRIDLRIDAGGKELAETVTAYKDAFRKNFKDVLFLFEEGTAVRGRTAYQFCVTFADGDPPLQQQALFTFIAEGSRRLVLSFNCSQAWFERYYGQVDASMKSMRLYPQPAATPEQKQRFLTAYNKGEAAYREGKPAEALAHFQEAAGVIPEFGDLQSTLGNLQQRLNRFPDAEAAYRRAIELDPEDAGPHYNLGVCLLKQSKYDAAIAALKRSTELEPASEPTLTNLGAAYLGRDRHEEARATLEKAVQVDPESPAAHYNLGLAYERLDRPRDAEREFKQALSADPAHADAPRALDRVKKVK